MRTASQLLHAHAGAPQAKESAPLPPGELCWLCAGDAARGMPVEDWQGANFTGQNRVRAPSARYICEACVWATARFSGVPGRPAKEGKEPPRICNVSHLYEETTDGVRYASASKGEKPLVLDFLRRPKAGLWFAAIAESGQKHVLPWTPVNPPGTARGRVLFEETLVALPGPGGLALVDEMAALLTAGATKEEMARGEYEPGTWLRCGDAIRAFEAAHGAQRHGAWWRLALFLAQRDEAAVAARLEAEKQARAAQKAAEKEAKKRDRRTKKSAARGDHRVPGRSEDGVPADAGSEPDEALGHAARAGAARVSDERQRGGVDDDAGAQPETAGTEQLPLFGAG